MPPLPRRAALAGLLPLAAWPVRAAPARPLLVELYTSQGCSSCPPADLLLGELAGRADLVALSLHVDYWNRLGWRDPHALAEATARQRVQCRRLGLSYVYTPQAVIEGARHLVGSDRAAMRAALAEARPRTQVALSLAREPGGLLVRTDAAGHDATVTLFAYRDADPVRVTAGENRGATLSHRNVVRRITRLGEARADAAWRIALEPGLSACAVAEAPDGSLLGLARLAA